jgi:hypothetical protein
VLIMYFMPPSKTEVGWGHFPSLFLEVMLSLVIQLFTPRLTGKLFYYTICHRILKGIIIIVMNNFFMDKLYRVGGY